MAAMLFEILYLFLRVGGGTLDGYRSGGELLLHQFVA